MSRFIWVVLTLLALLAVPASADSRAAPAATLDEFHQAASSADTERYFASMTDSVVFLGTDGAERWQGQEFRDFVRSHFERGRGWTYEPVERHITMSDSGQMAWFDEILRNDALGLCRGSGVLLWSGERWQIAQYNLSVPLPNAIVRDVAAQIAALDGSTDTQTLAQEAVPVAADNGTSATAEPETAEQTQPAAQDCSRRKRFKTNSRAGC